MIDNERNISFSKFELKNDGNVSVMWSIFHRYLTKGPIKVNVTLARLTYDILKIMTCHDPSIGDEMSN